MITTNKCILGLAIAFSGSLHASGASGENPRDPADRYYQLVDSADHCLRMEQWSKGESYITRALRSDPGNSGNTLLFSNLGVCQTQQGKLEKALESFNLALTRAKGSVTILTLRAKVLLSLGRLEEAERDLTHILNTDPTDEWALQTRGLLRIREIKKGEDRFADLIRLRESHPSNPWGWYGDGMYNVTHGDRQKGLDAYRKAWSLRREPEIAFQMSMVLLEEGELDEAGKCLRETLREHPRDGNLYVAMARLHKLSYQTEEAEADLSLAREFGASEELLKWIGNVPDRGR